MSFFDDLLDPPFNPDEIDPDLHDALGSIIENLELLDHSTMQGFKRVHPDARQEVTSLFRDVSDTDVRQLEELIETLHRTWYRLGNDYPADFKVAIDQLANWSGTGATAAKERIVRANEAIGIRVSNLSRLEAGAVAAHDIAVAAREDLKKLAEAFEESVKQFAASQHTKANVGLKVLSAALGGAATGLLGLALAPPTGGITLIAVGATGATGAAGGMLSAGFAEMSADPVQLAGGSPLELSESLMEKLTKMRLGMEHANGEVAAKLRQLTEMARGDEMPEPLDLVPGGNFDPVTFRTDEMPAALIQKFQEVRHPQGIADGIAPMDPGSTVSRRLSGLAG
ncbi:hypothetical protein SD37_17060 [Amycolatopsis orientalis]|uniref:Uncharacterized protein n=1 Tax=Amycolatopsis orientalis TaxID=31958 RepID=A0A193BY80_AMYOR|nr:hypothetical protein [Amycolatopsis orientalis]ANN17182.1 hypothetical protein SD37_17060 [Amycolatopsis orientalis]